MQSYILIDDLRKSLYTRLYYALVDSDYLIKALSKDEIEEMMKVISERKKLITEIIQFGNTRDKRFNWPNKKYNEVIDAIEEEYEIDRSKAYQTYEKDLRQKESEIKEVNKILSTQLADRYPEGEMESNLIFEYLKRNHASEKLTEVEEQVEEYRMDILDTKLQTQRDIYAEGEPERKKREKEKKRISEIANKKYQEFLQAWEKQREKDEKTKPKSRKLVEAWLKETGSKGADKERYTNLVDLLNLVGSLNSSDGAILRLDKYLNDSRIKIPEVDRTKLKEILLALENEQKKRNKKIGGSTKISPNATQAKSEGIKVGMKSKINKKSLSIKYGGNENLKINKTDYFIGFDKIDLRNPTWYNSPILRDIPMYWLGKAGFKGNVDKWEKLSEDEKTKFIKKVVGLLPDYPKLKPLATIESIYRNIWERNYALGTKEDPENFAYFAQGIRDGLMKTKGDTLANDYLRLQNFEQDTLPKLVKAIKSNIVVDTETGTIDFRLGPAFSKLMRKYKTMQERTEIIEDLIDIVKGKSLTQKYTGRNLKELAVIENNIIDIVSEKIEGETVLSYIITTFMEMYPSSKILARLLKDEDALVEVEYLKPSKVEGQTKDGKSIKDKTKKEYTESELLQLNEQTKRANLVKPLKLDKERSTTTSSVYVDDEGNTVEPEYNSKRIPRDLIDIESWKKDGRVLTFGKRKQDELTDEMKETKKSLDNLLVVIGEEDDIIVKEDIGLILESLNAKQRKKVKAILNIADPTEYFGHDFLKLSELVRVLKSLGVVKGDKKLNKKVLKLEDENLKVVKLATRLRKDYEKLYKQLREMVYPKLGEEK